MSTKAQTLGALVLVGLAALGAQLSAANASKLPTSTALSAWPTRGDRSADTALTQTATAHWDRQLGPHTAIRVLYAQDNELVGPLVVLTGVAQDRRVHVALLSRDRPTDAPRGPLRLRGDAFAPTTPVSAIGFLDVDHPDQQDDSRLAFALAGPSNKLAGFTSTAFDSYVEHPRQTDTAVTVLPASATTSNTQIQETGGTTRALLNTDHHPETPRRYGPDPIPPQG